MPRATSRNAKISAIVARMLLEIFRLALSRNPARSKNPARFVGQWMTVAAIRINDAEDKPPLSKSRLAAYTGQSRRSVREELERLEKRGLVELVDGGYVGNQDYVAGLDDGFYTALVAAVQKCVAELDAL